MKPILPALTLILLTTGLIIQMRNRSPYKDVVMDAQSVKNHRRGELLSFVGMVCFFVSHFWFK